MTNAGKAALDNFIEGNQDNQIDVERLQYLEDLVEEHLMIFIKSNILHERYCESGETQETFDIMMNYIDKLLDFLEIELEDYFYCIDCLTYDSEERWNCVNEYRNELENI